jgi:7-keto-8-aminopelargonate synthetase-like enzyme
MKLEKAPNRTLSVNGITHLHFSGTSYLGMAALPEFHEIIFENIKKWGSCYGSSRNANIKLNIYDKAEEFLANFFKTEACLTVSSGTVAGLLALSTLEKIASTFFYMPKTHPAILPKNALPVFEENTLNPLLLNTKKETICIVVDAIAALETKPFNFDFLQAISSEKKIVLLVDESHSLGVLGAGGNGISSGTKTKNPIEVISVSSLGKAFALNGGIISGKKSFIDLVKENPLFVGSAPMNPAFLESFLNAQELYKNQLKKLQEHCKYVYQNLKKIDRINISEKYPVFFLDAKDVADFLASKKIRITSFRYPTSTKKMNRIVLNANHTKEDLDILIHCLTSYFQ